MFINTRNYFESEGWISIPEWFDWEWKLDWNANDTSWNWYNWTASWISYSTPAWASIQVAEFRATWANAWDLVDLDSYASNFEYTWWAGWEFTVSFWAKFEVLQPWSTAAGIYAVTFDGSWWDFSWYWAYLFSWAWDVWFRVFVNNTTAVDCKSTTTWMNDWTTRRHFVMSKDNTWMYLYINNSLDQSNTTANAQSTIRYRSSNTMNIWCRHDASSWAHQGHVSADMCLFRVYPSVLSAADRTSLYDEWVSLLWL